MASSAGAVGVDAKVKAPLEWSEEPSDVPPASTLLALFMEEVAALYPVSVRCWAKRHAYRPNSAKGLCW